MSVLKLYFYVNQYYKIELKEIDIYEVDFEGDKSTSGSYIKVIDELIALAKIVDKKFGYLFKVEDANADPKAKNYGKKLSALLETNQLHVGTVVIHPSIFMQMIIRTFERDILFSRTVEGGMDILLEKAEVFNC